MLAVIQKDIHRAVDNVQSIILSLSFIVYIFELRDPASEIRALVARAGAKTELLLPKCCLSRVFGWAEGGARHQIRIWIFWIWGFCSRTNSAVPCWFSQDVHHSMIGDLYLGSGESRRRLAIYCLKASRFCGSEFSVCVVPGFPSRDHFKSETDCHRRFCSRVQVGPIMTGHPFCLRGCIPPNAAHGEVVVYVSCQDQLWRKQFSTTCDHLQCQGTTTWRWQGWQELRSISCWIVGRWSRYSRILRQKRMAVPILCDFYCLLSSNDSYGGFLK